MTAATKQSITADIQQALSVFCEPGQVVELRVPRVDGKKRTDSGYFNDLGKLAAAAVRYDGRASGVYFTLNPVEPALLARAANRVQEWAELSTSDEYIARRRWLPIDCDPRLGGKKRPAGISSTDDEHAAAIAKANQIREWLATAGWPEPVEADSGNGGALLYAIDLPNDDASKALIEQCLKALAAQFNDSQVDIDTTVHNAARIWKVYGTTAGKGDSTTERPHRRASLLRVPRTIKAVSLSLLQTLARRVQPEKQTAQPTPQRTGIDPERWLERFNIEVSGIKQDGPSTIYQLAECPFNENHKGSATVIQRQSGALAFRCLHDSCKNYDWRALRVKFEPGAYDRRNGVEVRPSTTAEPEAPALAPKSELIIRALSNLGYSFRLNECSDTVEVNGARIDEVQHAIMMTALRDRDFKNEKMIEQAWITEAARNRFHPIRDYLNSCVWDGEPHIERLAAHLVCADSPVVYEDGAVVPLSTVYLWRWLIGAVAKVFDQAQNLMLVFAGPQWIGKSSFCRWLCSSIPQCHIETPLTVGERDTEIRLMNYFIWEVAELDATTRKSDVAALKSFITRQTVIARKAYGHHDTVKPACASLFGSINPGAGFLADETGNRRFYVTTLDSIDWNYTKIPVDQVWAQAVHLYRSGESYQLQPNEYQHQKDTNREHEVDTLIDDWIQRHFILDTEPTEAMSAAEIVDHLRKRYDIRLTGTERAQAMEIGRAMVKFGIKKRQRGGRGVREYIGVMPRDP